MIQEFSVTNYRSIKDRQTISFLANKRMESGAEQYTTVDISDSVRLLKFAVLYGYNASGKTNIIQALDFLRYLVVDGRETKDILIKLNPFKFDSKTVKQPSEFNLIFYIDKIKYDYLIVLDKKRIYKEILNFWPEGRKARIYNRYSDLEKNVSKITFGTKVDLSNKDKNFIVGNTLDNNTVLYTYQKTNITNEELKNVYNYFHNSVLPLISPRTALREWTINQFIKNDKNKGILLQLMKKADFQIDEFEAKKVIVPLPDDKNFLEKIRLLNEGNKKLNDSEIKEIEKNELYFNHKTKLGNFELKSTEESEGTQRYFGLGGILRILIEENCYVGIDELESSLHPDLVTFLLEIFFVNSNNSQILATTHAQYLMELDFIRRDMVWFCEKDEKGLERLTEDNKDFKIYENEKDSQQDIDKIPQLSKDDLPKEIRTFEHEKYIIEGVETYLQSLETNQIIYTDGFFKIENLDLEQLKKVPILIRMLQLSGIGDLSYDQVALKIRDKTGGLSLFLESSSIFGEEKEEFFAIGFRLKSLKEENSEALELLSDILRNSNLDDLERLKATINDLTSSFESSIGAVPQMFAAQRASASFSALLYKNELLNGIKQWLFLEEIDLENSDELKELSLELEKLRNQIIKKENLILHICNESSSAEGIKEFINSFEQKSKESFNKSEKVPVVKDIELFRIPSPVSSTSLATFSAKAGSKLQAHQTILSHILTTNHLWTQIRGSGGAYGAFSQVDLLEELVVFNTYRDPRIKASLNDIKKILDEIALNGVGQNILDKSIINIVGREIRPLYPKEASIITFRRELYNISDSFRAQRRADLLNTTVEDIKNAAKAIIEAIDKKSKTVVIGSQKLFDKDQFEVHSTKLPL
jgi:AAA15 family ATPase/GTPase